MKKRLSELKPNKSGVIFSLQSQGSLNKRLLDMGFIKGTALQVIKVAPLGDPIDIRIKGYHLSLRKNEAAQIIVEVD
jgi:Fe2+ transport system protein FeoA